MIGASKLIFKKQLLSGTLVAFFVSILLVSSAGAIQYGDVGGKPANPRANNSRSEAIFIHSIDPGETVKDGIKVFNNTDSKKDIAVYAVDSILASDGSLACAQQIETPKDVGKWIKLATNKLTLGPRQDKVVQFTITPPVGADVGEHNGCITIQDVSRPPVKGSDSGVMLSFRSALRVAVTIPGNIVKGLDITKVAVLKDANSLYQVMPTIKNTGNVSLDTDINVKLKSWLGSLLEVAEATYPILPQSGASWDFKVQERPFWGGWYRADVAASYNVSTNAELGSQKDLEVKTVRRSSGVFFMLPSLLGGLIEVLVLLVVVAAVVFGIRRHRDRRIVAKNWNNYIVKKGQTIQDIADQHSTSWKKLARTNQLKAPYDLKGQQKIKVPPKPNDKG